MVLTGLVCGTVVAVSGCVYWQVMVTVVSWVLVVVQDKLEGYNKKSRRLDLSFKSR